jgi:hypothetical protein
MISSTQLLDITNFIVKNFKNHKIWNVEITSPESIDESADGFAKHGIVEVSATYSQGNWNAHTFVFNSPENVDEETKSYFTNHTFPLFVNTANTLLWEE